MTSILGISAFYHDSAACILKDGKIIAAAQEERFTRKKHDPNYPHNAIQFVLKYANLKLSEVDQIVFFEKPFLKFERLLETYVAFAPRGFISFAKAMPIWIKEKLFQKNFLFNKLKIHDKDYKSDKNIFFSDHHLSHAASAFFPSPFKEAIVLTLDGTHSFTAGKLVTQPAGGTMQGMVKTTTSSANTVTLIGVTGTFNTTNPIFEDNVTTSRTPSNVSTTYTDKPMWTTTIDGGTF